MRFKNKYGNIKVAVDGIDFDSKKEANRYSELKLLEKAGVIKDLELQKKFELIPSQRMLIDGKWRVVERSVDYYADFTYYDNEKKETVVEDTKGYRTADYIIKRKLLLHRYGIRIKEI